MQLMAGSIELPILADGLGTLPDGTNIYGYNFEEYEWEMQGNDAANQQLSLTTPKSREPPPSEFSMAFLTTRDTTSPTNTTLTVVPTNISIPSTNPSIISAPYQLPMAQTGRAPRTTNIAPPSS